MMPRRAIVIGGLSGCRPIGHQRRSPTRQTEQRTGAVPCGSAPFRDDPGRTHRSDSRGCTVPALLGMPLSALASPMLAENDACGAEKRTSIHPGRQWSTPCAGSEGFSDGSSRPDRCEWLLAAVGKRMPRTAASLRAHQAADTALDSRRRQRNSSCSCCRAGLPLSSSRLLAVSRGCVVELCGSCA